MGGLWRKNPTAWWRHAALWDPEPGVYAVAKDDDAVLDCNLVLLHGGFQLIVALLYGSWDWEGSILGQVRGCPTAGQT